MLSNVLIVDDSRGMRTVIRRILLLSEFETGLCLEAGDDQEALEVLKHEKVDIVLPDTNMPNTNREELLRMVAYAWLACIPVPVISTDRSDERMQRMLAFGARGYVTKPFVPEQLGAALARLMEDPQYAGK